jgi:restriction system protein
MWKINGGRGSRLAQEFLDHSVVAIGWREVGSVTGLKRRDEIIDRVATAYPENTPRQNEVAGNQIWRFLNEIKDGDDVITYDPIDRVYHLGVITQSPEFRPDIIDVLPTMRSVKWREKVGRDRLSAAARGRLGAILTLFKVPDVAADEIRSLAQGNQAATPTIEEAPEIAEATDPFDAITEQALERTKDKLLSLGWEDMQEMVAALLRALGYRTIVSAVGPDRGKDIIASPDGFGFEQPRIVVEVKHRKGAMGAPEIRAFLGGRHSGDRGLYVSTGGFTREAYFEAERATNVTHLMNLDGLAQALIDNYDRIDERGRALLPLTKIYWPK